ncbi:MAG: hypothetical protein WBY28_11845 [Nitrososphaeraceae archaeon]
MSSYVLLMLSAAVMFSDIMLSAFSAIVLGNIDNRHEEKITVRTVATIKVSFDRFVVILMLL